MKKSPSSRKRTKEISHSCFPKATGQHAKRRCGQKRMIIDVTPDKQHNFGQDEEDLLVKLHALLGNRWSLIAGRLPGRTKEEVEKYCNSHLERKLVSTGVDPNNHHVNEAICQTSSSSSCSCSLNYHPDDDDETRSSQQKMEREVVTNEPSQLLKLNHVPFNIPINK